MYGGSLSPPETGSPWNVPGGPGMSEESRNVSWRALPFFFLTNDERRATDAAAGHGIDRPDGWSWLLLEAAGEGSNEGSR